MDCVTCSTLVCRERDKRIGLNMTPSNTTPLLSVRNLRVGLQTSHGQLEALRGVDFEMQRGESPHYTVNVPFKFSAKFVR